jgi:hypothetical protein
MLTLKALTMNPQYTVLDMIVTLLAFAFALAGITLALAGPF